MNKKIIASILSLAMCGSLVTGATYALFTSEAKTDISITSGKVQVDATVDIESAKTKSYGYTYEDNQGLSPEASFSLAEDGTVVLGNIVPGDGVEFDIDVANTSSVSIWWRMEVAAIEGSLNGLKITVEGQEYAGDSAIYTKWASVDVGEAVNGDGKFTVAVELPAEAGNEHQGKTTKFAVSVNTVQGNVEVVDAWDGTLDYEGLAANTNTEEKVVEIATAEQLAAFAANVNAKQSYQGYTVTLTKDIDLANRNWTPINGWEGVLNGTVIDGGYHTIKNMRVDGGNEAGFISVNASSLTIKNLTFDNAYVKTTDGSSKYAGVVMGKNYSPVTIEDVTVVNSQVRCTWQCGGFVGFAETNAPTFISCTITDSFVGGYNCTAGALFGLGAVDVTAENCTARNVDLYTDMDAGLVGYLYGKTLTATNCTVENVNVVSEYPAN